MIPRETWHQYTFAPPTHTHTYFSVPRTKASQYGLWSLKCRKQESRGASFCSLSYYFLNSHEMPLKINLLATAVLGFQPVTACLQRKGNSVPGKSHSSSEPRTEVGSNSPFCWLSFITNPQPSSSQPNKKPLYLCPLSAISSPRTLQDIMLKNDSSYRFQYHLLHIHLCSHLKQLTISDGQTPGQGGAWGRNPS